jgi:hypothetical protein
VRLLLPTLDRGEAEVITLALERQARLALMDELAGRKVAESLNLSGSKFTPLANAAGPVIVKALVPGRHGRPCQRFVWPSKPALGGAS